MTTLPTGLEWWKDFASIAQSVGTIGIAAAGGAWAFWKFGLKQDWYPHIETFLDIKFLGTQGDHWIVELLAHVENKGGAQHRMYDLNFTLSTIAREDELQDKEIEETEDSEETHGELDFPHVVKQGTFLKDFDYYAVDGGVKANYTYITRLPKDASFARLSVSFRYDDKREFYHLIERTLRVPTDLSAARENAVAHDAPAR